MCTHRPRLIGLLAAAAASGGAITHAQPVRLELRIVPQSGIPGVACVYDDPPNPLGGASPPREAWVSPNIAKRFEVQYRLIDSDPADGRVPAGLHSVTLSILATSTTAGLWGRGLLSVLEGESVAAADQPAPAAIDCSGLPTLPTLRKRGLHQPYRTLLMAAGAPLGDPSEDPDNGAFQPAGLTAINAATAGPPAHGAGAWFGLYTFEFTPAAAFTGSLTITAASVPSGSGIAFRGYDTTGTIQSIAAAAHPPAVTTITLRAPAPIAACCPRNRCTIAPTPSACFASGGFIATGNTCGPTPTSTCCFADFNRDGSVGVQDVFDFITAYLTDSPAADVDGSGKVTVRDVFEYLAVYFVGCG